MEFIKSWKFMAIIFAVLCVVSIAGVIYGVTTHTEPGLMDTTPGWTPSDFPLEVCVYTYTSESPQSAASAEDLGNAHHVFDTINDRLGFPAYRAHVRGGCDVMLVYGAPAEAGWQDPGGSAEISDHFCDVVISNVHGELQTLAVEHELGHCLGLDHDDWEGSIMRRTQSETPDRAFPPRITDSDRELLRELYGPR